MRNHTGKARHAIAAAGRGVVLVVIALSTTLVVSDVGYGQLISGQATLQENASVGNHQVSRSVVFTPGGKTVTDILVDGKAPDSPILPIGNGRGVDLRDPDLAVRSLLWLRLRHLAAAVAVFAALGVALAVRRLKQRRRHS